MTDNDQLTVALSRLGALEEALLQIASGDCTGLDEQFTCPVSLIKGIKWCPKCIAEHALSNSKSP